MTRSTTAAVFRGAGTALELVHFPVPTPQGTELLVEVIACTLCGSDLHSLHGRRAVPVPTILGHETLGRIAEFGPDAPRLDAAGRALSIGDRVTWAIVASCGECFYCRRLLPQKCERQTKYGHEPLRLGHELTGGLAGHCLLAPGTAVYRIPEILSDAAACPANCAGATVAAAIDAAGPLAGSRVLVMGSGMLGVTTAAWARAQGAEHVIACDTDPGRLALAATFGSTHLAATNDVDIVIKDCTGGYGVDVVFEMTGSPEALESALPLTRTGGSVVLVGSVFPSRPVSVFPEQIVRRCLTLRGVHNYAPRHLNSALEFLAASRQLRFADLVTDWAPLTVLSRVLAEPLPRDRLRVGIRPQA